MSSELTLVEYEGHLIPVDEKGLPWMSQADIAEWLELSKGAVSNAVKSALETGAPEKSSDRLGIPLVSRYETRGSTGQTYQVTRYNFTVISMVAMRANKSAVALGFQIWALEQLARSFMTEMQERNSNLQTALYHEQQARLTAEWESEKAQQELNNHILLEIEQRYPEEFQD